MNENAEKSCLYISNLSDKISFTHETMRQINSNIIIIIIKKDRQCKAEKEWYTPYESDDPSPTIPTYRQKEEKGKRVEDYSRDRSA